MYDDRFAGHDQDALALGSVVGIRYWSLTAPFHGDDGALAVQLDGARGRWVPGVNEAECRGSMRHPPQMIPVQNGCGCGFWAYWAEDPGGGHAYVRSPDVAGMIEGWGRYVAGTKGFRCAKAKILALCVQTHPGYSEEWRVTAEQALAAVYQVPVYSSVTTMLKAFPPSRSPAPPPFPGGLVASGGGYSAGGYSAGGYLSHVSTTVVLCLCGQRWGMSPGASITCMCGRSWSWNGLTGPVTTSPQRAADALKSLEQKKDSPS